VIGMSAASIAEFLNSPYALIVDVRMLSFFRYLSGAAAWAIFGLVIASIFVQNSWCRYLCPYGGFLGLVSLLSPTRITRNSSTCIDCAMCAKACPSALPVDKLPQIRSAECTGCLECVAICPAKGALAMSVLAGEQKRRAIPAWSMAAGIAILILGMVGYAKATWPVGHESAEAGLFPTRAECETATSPNARGTGMAQLMSPCCPLSHRREIAGTRDSNE
jgi:polyferredoxin